MKKAKAKAGTDEIPEVEAAPAPPAPVSGIIGGPLSDTQQVPDRVYTVRLESAECAAIEAAYKAGNEALSPIVHKMYLFGYRPRP